MFLVCVVVWGFGGLVGIVKILSGQRGLGFFTGLQPLLTCFNGSEGAFTLNYVD